jgi:5-methylthioribose kinase
VPGYYEFDVETAASFAAPYLDGPVLGATEVGDGNLNRVFRVGSAQSSVVVKQALPYLKVAGTDWPLTRNRAGIERSALNEHSRLVPGHLPAVVHFDEALSAIVLEDLQGYQSWRELLIAGIPTPGVAARLGRYSAGVLLGTSHVIQPSEERRQMRSRFGYSELCLVTEELVFTAPFTDSVSNRYDQELADMAMALRHDKALRTAAAELRYVFRTRDEALIHGDLHTGSVLVGPQDSRVIDLEFAFFGPIGFDLGLMLANLALSAIAHSAQGNREYADLVGTYAAEFWHSFTEESRRIWKPNEPWFHRFIAGILADAGQFAGLEMIRRIVGMAHVSDIDSLHPPTRLRAQQLALDGGRSLAVGAPCTSLDELWHRATHDEST